MAEISTKNEIKIINIETGMFQYFLIFHSVEKIKLETQSNTFQTRFHINRVDFSKSKNINPTVTETNPNTNQQKRVKFADKPDIRIMYTWQFAYEQARKDKWQEVTRDHDRFERKIKRLSKIITPILEKKLEKNRELYKK